MSTRRGLLLSTLILLIGVACNRAETVQPSVAPIVQTYSAQPAWSPAGDKIAYLGTPRGGSGGRGIWILDLATGDDVYVGPGILPAWSADGQQLAYSLDGDIQVIDVATGQRRSMAHGGCYFPAWSPDGLRLAFDRIAPRDSAGIWIVETEGAQPPRRLLAGGLAREPAWSPDGRKLAFMGGPHLSDVYVVATAEGDTLQRVNCPDGGQRIRPRWSPDGTRIAVGGYEGIWLVDVASGSSGRIEATVDLTVRFSEGQMADWSPDGDRLVYNRQVLWVTTLDGGINEPVQQNMTME